MALVQSFDQAKSAQVIRQKNDSGGSTGTSTKIPFFGSRDAPDSPHASLSQWDPARISRTHFHENDQFQVVVSGKGKLGRHSLSPYSVHFSRAYTPYGPLLSDQDIPLSFFVMRPRFDPGSQRLPKEMEKLKAASHRQPWQITSQVTFPPSQTDASGPDITLQTVPGIQDDNGLATYTLTVRPNATGYAPDPSRSGGQYVVVVRGSLLHNDAEYKAWALVFVAADEKAFEIHAGVDGLEAIVINFPRLARLAENTVTPQIATTLKKWRCQICGLVYDEAAGLPEDGIAPGTRWQDVPASWSCPDCSASKADFQMVETIS